MDTCLCVEVYLILWFWFFSLLVVTGAQLVVRVTTLTIPPLRLGLLILRSRSYNSADIATIRSTFSYQMSHRKYCNVFGGAQFVQLR